MIYDAHVCPPFSNNLNLDCLKLLKESGICFASLNVGFGNMGPAEILPIINRISTYIEGNPKDYKLIRKIDECDMNSVNISFDLEGIHAIDKNIDMLRIYKELGVKQILLAYNKNNIAAGGCDDVDTGLTLFGKAIVKEMNDLGLLIDCSHTGSKTTFDIMELSKSPVIFSHSNPKKLKDHPRNITDDQIKKCAEVGGVVGVNGISIFLNDKSKLLDGLVEAIDHIVQLVGIHHVGIGSDYVFDEVEVKKIVKNNKILFPPEQNYNDVSMINPKELSSLPFHLSNKGYKKEDIDLILHGNFIRVVGAVWN